MDAVRDLVHRYAGAWEQNDRAGWLETFAEDATQEDPVGSAVRRGRAEIGGFWDDAMGHHRSLAVESREIFVAGDGAAMVWRITGELDEGWRVFGGVDVFTFDATPLIASVRAYWVSEDRRFVPRTTAIHHLALIEQWNAPTLDYRSSTIDRTLEEEGFIHCSYGEQVADTAHRYYADRDDVLLLTIDPGAVPSEIKVEGGFPHIYGPLPRDAVIRVTPYG